MAPEPLGFKLSLGAGRAFDLFNFADTANGFDNLRYIPQAYISYKPAAAKGFQLDFGKFYTVRRRGADRNTSRLELLPRLHVRQRTVLPLRPAHLDAAHQELHRRRPTGERLEQRRGQQQRKDRRHHHRR